MTKWREVRLGDIAPFKYGKSKVAKDRIKGKYKVFSSAGECGFSDDILAYRGIIIGRKGSVGKVYFSKDPFFCIDTAFYIDEVEENTDLSFIYYYLPMLKLENYNNDAAVPGLNRNLAHNIKIKIPDLKTQEKIANVLSTYDKLIENNNRRIELLEQMAEEIYKEWFVRMRFPGHEETKFEKGIPEGWEVKRIENLGEIITGKTPSTKNPLYYGNDVLFVKTPDMHNNTFITNTETMLSTLGSESQINKLLPKNSIMVSCIGTGGVVSINSKGAHTNQQINSIILKDIVLREWAYLTLKSMKGTIEAFGSTGATMTNLSKGKFEKLKILWPTKKLILKFNLFSKQIFDQILQLNQQNQNLIKQRDMLLPRLMNGTIEVE